MTRSICTCTAYFILIVCHISGLSSSPSDLLRKKKYEHADSNTISIFSTRRSFMQNVMIASFICWPSDPAVADLIQFPIKSNLKNTYHFMRAGQSLLESQDIFSSNALFLTNREDALSTLGIEQVQEACKFLSRHDVNPSLVKFSLAAKSIDTANILAAEMHIGRDRLVPEYTFMDPRGVGKWDRRSISVVESALFAMDSMAAGDNGETARPPPHDDGTSNETLADQVTRLRELISLCESHCSGETILLIFADGTSPALLTSLITGFPLNRVHEIEYKSGEVRLNINKDTPIPQSIQTSKEYIDRISEGQVNLQLLQNEEKKLALDEARRVALMKEFKNTRSERSIQMRQSLNSKRVSTEPDLSISPYFSLTLAIVAAILSSNIKYLEHSSEREENITNEDQSECLENVEYLVHNFDKEGSLQKLEELVLHAPFAIPEFDEQERVDRNRKAREAMTEYMNRDDGSEAYIGMLKDLLHEDYST